MLHTSQLAENYSNDNDNRSWTKLYHSTYSYLRIKIYVMSANFRCTIIKGLSMSILNKDLHLTKLCHWHINVKMETPVIYTPFLGFLCDGLGKVCICVYTFSSQNCYLHTAQLYNLTFWRRNYFFNFSTLCI